MSAAEAMKITLAEKDLNENGYYRVVGSDERGITYRDYTGTRHMASPLEKIINNLVLICGNEICGYARHQKAAALAETDGKFAFHAAHGLREEYDW